MDNFLSFIFSEPGVYCGGDLAGVAETAVEAVNDGKVIINSCYSNQPLLKLLMRER